MSASTERKNRAAAREAGTDKKTLAQQESAKKEAKARRHVTVAAVCVALLLVLVLVLQSGFFYAHTTAVKIGDRSYSPAEVNYQYASAFYEFSNNYGSYASMFGLDTSVGPFGLRHQECSMLENGTWRDYFLQSAYSSMAQIQALRDYALSEGLSLSDEEKEQIDSDLASLAETASTYGYSKINNYLSANYGTGVTTKTLREASEASLLANAGYQHYSDSLTYSPEELESTYAGLEGASDYYDYAYYFVSAEAEDAEEEEAFIEEDEDLAEDEESEEPEESAVSEEALQEAKASAEAVRTSYLDDKDTEDVGERLAAAIEGALDKVESILPAHSMGSNLNEAYADFLKDAARKTGDITVVENGDGTGYYVVAFISHDDNHYRTANVRHILIQAEASEDGTWSDEALAAAKARAEEILAEWKSGDKTEDSFAELAKQYSEDGGSSANGGLYENVAKGQMVEEFDAFCYGGHKAGDTAIVYGTNGQYAGYHVMYYVGEGELYSNVIARDKLTSEAVSAWLEEITPETKPGAFEWLAGK